MIGRLQVRLGENTHENGLFSAPCPSVFIVRDDTWFATHAGCAWEPGARCTERPAASTRVVYAWHGYPVWSACVDIRGVERRANEEDGSGIGEVDVSGTDRRNMIGCEMCTDLNCVVMTIDVCSHDATVSNAWRGGVSLLHGHSSAYYSVSCGTERRVWCYTFVGAVLLLCRPRVGVVSCVLWHSEEGGERWHGGAGEGQMSCGVGNCALCAVCHVCDCGVYCRVCGIILWGLLCCARYDVSCGVQCEALCARAGRGGEGVCGRRHLRCTSWLLGTSLKRGRCMHGLASLALHEPSCEVTYQNCCVLCWRGCCTMCVYYGACGVVCGGCLVLACTIHRAGLGVGPAACCAMCVYYGACGVVCGGCLALACTIHRAGLGVGPATCCAMCVYYGACAVVCEGCLALACTIHRVGLGVGPAACCAMCVYYGAGGVVCGPCIRGLARGPGGGASRLARASCQHEGAEEAPLRYLR